MAGILFHIAQSNQIPEGAYARYIGDDIVSTSNWPSSVVGGPSLTNVVGSEIAIETDGPNNHQYMKFGHDGGSNDTHIKSDSIATIPDGFTIAMVFKKNANTWFSGTIFSVGPAAYSYAISLYLNGGAQQTTLEGHGGSLHSALWQGSDNIEVDTWTLWTCRYINTPNYYEGSYYGHWSVNGVNTQYCTSGRYSTNSPQVISLGRAAGQSSAHYARSIADFIYYKSFLSDDDFEQLQTSLMGIYGIS